MPTYAKNYELILKVLYYALLEIRATTNIRKAQSLADVFHNVPGGISMGRDPDDIREHLEQTAARLGCQDYINALFECAMRNMKK